MIDIAHELDNLRSHLGLKYTAEVIEQLINDAKAEIESSIESLLEDAINSARQSARDKGQEDFADKLTMTRKGSSHHVSNPFGSMDLSSPPFPMLPKLLKSAKVAKDGSMYKVIPISNDPSSGISGSMSKFHNKKKGPVAAFRVASSKQDPTTKWVHPGFKMDFTSEMELIDINLNMEIDRVVNNIVDRYRKM